MMNLREIFTNFPYKTVGTHQVSANNVVEIVREDGSGYSYNAVLVIDDKEQLAYVRFHPVTKECISFVVNGVKYI